MPHMYQIQQCYTNISFSYNIIQLVSDKTETNITISGSFPKVAQSVRQLKQIELFE